MKGSKAGEKEGERKRGRVKWGKGREGGLNGEKGGREEKREEGGRR